MTTISGVAQATQLDAGALDQLFRDARTANTFTDDPVTDADIRELYELVKWGPTAFNQQPLRGVVVRSEEARARLVPLMSDGNQAKVAAAPAVLILAADNDFHEQLPEQFPVFPEAKDVFFSEREARQPSAIVNASLQIGYVILGIRALGFAAGPMNGFDSEAVTKEFFSDRDAQALVVVNIGRPGPNAWFPRLPRLTFEQAFEVV
jgi:3-hydroxypropanoate dehydrogenase